MPVKELREYRSWWSMRQRCYDPSSISYPNYGGRGIGVCPRWRSFALFLRDMGPRPLGMSLHRKNNDLGYSPTNCCWATMREQQRNKRNSRLMTFQGRTLTQIEWSEITGVGVATLCSRRRHGWSIEDMLTIPIDKKAALDRYWKQVQSKRPRCKRGHALTPENIYDRGGSNRRDCRKCALFRANRFRRKRQEVQSCAGPSASRS
jgi:hypothetical protein